MISSDVLNQISFLARLANQNDGAIHSALAKRAANLELMTGGDTALLYASLTAYSELRDVCSNEVHHLRLTIKQQILDLLSH